MAFLATKLIGKEVRELDENDIDDLLASLTAEELEQLSNEVDPDDSLLPPSQRCKDQTKKAPTGPLNRKKLLDYLERTAREQADWPEAKPYEPGLKRGKIWKPKEVPKPKTDDLEIELDLDDEYEQALGTADEAELVDLAAILGLHSMLNQDQFHSSILNKGQKIGDRFESIVHATKPKVLPMEPDNDTDVDRTLDQVVKNESSLKKLNWNNIRNISREKMKRLFEGLKTNTNLEYLSLANVDLYDVSAEEPPVKRDYPLTGLLKENSRKRTKMPTEQEAKPAVVTPSLQQWRSPSTFRGAPGEDPLKWLKEYDRVANFMT
ncbi:tropomodulin [Trichonephila clavipes]|nr:tropomodulin [Trichonephila clavipes]